MTTAFVVEPELKAFLKPLTDEARATLKRQIIERGRISDPLKVAVPSRLLLDGHNRAELRDEAIAEGHDIAEPPIEEISIADGLIPAMEWMYENQKGRRNWTKADDDYAIGKIQIERKKAAHRPVEQPDEGVKNKGDTGVTLIGKTAATVAEETGCSERTVYRKSKYAEALDKIRDTNSKAADDIRSGSLKVSNKDAIAIAASGDIPAALRNLRNGKPWNSQPEAASTAPPREHPEAAPPKSDEVFDDLKRPSPEHLAAVFESMQEFKSLNRKLGGLKNDVKALCDLPGGVELKSQWQAFEAGIKSAQSTLKFSTPYTECPRCKGDVKDDCDLCRGHGFIVRGQDGRLLDADRAWLGLK